MKTTKLIHDILAARGIKTKTEQADFLNPDYEKSKHDPFLLPDMKKAVARIKKALKADEKVTIYGDYDIDGMTATVILLKSLGKFGLNVKTYTPDRFSEGYGLNINAVEEIAADGTKLIITVDNGTLSFDEIARAKELGVDVIVTDHHTPHDELPDAVAIVNPHRRDSKYPFSDLAGCGVALKLVQALQTALDGLAEGQEKWLLDLVALGTVCDIVSLLDENRNNVYWGIEVLKKTRRPGLRALMAVARIKPEEINTRRIGFVLGPRLNAAGRLETAEYALELLSTEDPARALELAEKLDRLNLERRAEQDKIFSEAVEIIGETSRGDVIVVARKGWNEGVIGIVASKLVERYQCPAFVLAIGETETKGSGRSFGDFSLAAAIHATRPHLIKGGGHAAAGGVTVLSSKIEIWQTALVDYHRSLNLKNQAHHLLVKEDVVEITLSGFNANLVHELEKLEPFGMGNERPIFRLSNMHARYVDRVGALKNHLKLTLEDDSHHLLKFLAFDPPEDWFVELGAQVDVWVTLEINDWNGSQTVEGRILRLEHQ
ncbi:single-stranded-DNA-specific exonuclease RecJ [Candidatus Saccharibacteria bacterium]|nr:single-stranded-DNA-specific exonuclease RecJ [Candidatus Saccharibacteria bacterium]